jgi:hypothetical protein
LPPAESPAARAEAAFTGGRLADLAGDASAAVSGYRAALDENPFHHEARVRLVTLLTEQGDAAGATAVAMHARELALPPGPHLERALANAQVK